MKEYSKWLGKGSYSEGNVFGIDQVTPWNLDNTNRKCIINCTSGYRSNWDSSHYSTTNVLDQKCISDNCKDYNSQWGLPSKCTECWTKDEVDNYSTFPARYSYDEQELVGRRKD